MDTAKQVNEYAFPQSLVSTEWVSQNLDNPKVRIIESNEDQLLFHSGHIPGAVEVDWVRDLNDPLKRDYLNRDGFETLMKKIGVSNDTTIILYGDKNNWWACYALWVFRLFNHNDVRIMNGGRLKWEKEGRALSKEKSTYTTSNYKAPERNDSLYRAFREDVLTHINKKLPLIDVRSPEEYRGERLHMEGYPNEGALRGGHIPGAKSVPWARASNPEDGTFKTVAELKSIYEGEAGLSPDKEVIAYCRIGERSSLTWFVLTYLLGYPKVKNYDGSWTEWGNSVGVPIER